MPSLVKLLIQEFFVGQRDTKTVLWNWPFCVRVCWRVSRVLPPCLFLRQVCFLFLVVRECWDTWKVLYFLLSAAFIYTDRCLWTSVTLKEFSIISHCTGTCSQFIPFVVCEVYLVCYWVFNLVAFLFYISFMLYTVKLHYNGLGYNRYSFIRLFSGPGWISVNFNMWQYG